MTDTDDLAKQPDEQDPQPQKENRFSVDDLTELEPIRLPGLVNGMTIFGECR